MDSAARVARHSRDNARGGHGVLLARDLGRVLTTLAGMARLGSAVVAAFAFGLFVVSRRHGRGGGRPWSIFDLPDEARGHLEHDENDGLFAQSEDGLGLLPRHGEGPLDRGLDSLRFHAGIL